MKDVSVRESARCCSPTSENSTRSSFQYTTPSRAKNGRPSPTGARAPRSADPSARSAAEPSLPSVDQEERLEGGVDHERSSLRIDSDIGGSGRSSDLDPLGRGGRIHACGLLVPREYLSVGPGDPRVVVVLDPDVERRHAGKDLPAARGRVTRGTAKDLAERGHHPRNAVRAHRNAGRAAVRLLVIPVRAVPLVNAEA